MSILFAIVLFSVLIFVHELGHFITAKLSGVQVNEFSLFMGPAIYKKQVGETLYAIRCIPIGGYCAMEGEDEESENPRSFQRAAWWKRLIILAAGSCMNLLAGLVIFAIVFAPAQQFVTPVVAQMEENCSMAEGGLQVGDRILALDNERIYVQNDFSMLLKLKKAEAHDMTVLRDGQTLVLKQVPTVMKEYANEDGTVSLRYGLSFSVEKATFGSRMAYVWNTAVDTVRIVRLSLQMLLTGQVGLQDMSGPVGIVQEISNTAAASPDALSAFLNMLYFGGFLAVNLAVMNLLPIPALDGGRIVCLLLTTAAEAIFRRKIDPKYEAYLHAGGMVLLLLLMAVVTFKDLFTIFRG